MYLLIGLHFHAQSGKGTWKLAIVFFCPSWFPVQQRMCWNKDKLDCGCWDFVVFWLALACSSMSDAIVQNMPQSNGQCRSVMIDRWWSYHVYPTCADRKTSGSDVTDDLTMTLGWADRQKLIRQPYISVLSPELYYTIDFIQREKLFMSAFKICVCGL